MCCLPSVHCTVVTSHLSVTWMTDAIARERTAMPNQTIESFASENRLIAALPPGDRERLLLHCRPVVLPNEQVLVAPGEEVRYAYFPTDGVVALLMVMEDGTPVEVATVGYRGLRQRRVDPEHEPEPLRSHLPDRGGGPARRPGPSAGRVPRERAAARLLLRYASVSSVALAARWPAR